MIANGHPTQATIITKVLVVNNLLVYNAIIRCPTLNVLCAIASTYHLVMKFLTPVRVGVILSNQVEVQRC